MLADGWIFANNPLKQHGDISLPLEKTRRKIK
jgi:hypothetical protein